MTNRSRVNALTFVLGAIALLVCGGIGFGQDVQTGSCALPGASGIVEGSTGLTNQVQLLELLEAAGTGGFLTDDQAIAILHAAGVGLLNEGNAETAAQVQNALVMALNAVNAGTIDPEGAVTALNVAMGQDDPLVALSAVLNEQASPPGVLTAIGNAALKAGYVQSESTALVDQVKIALQEGVPPGIVVRVAKQALRSGLSAQEQVARVAALLKDGNTPPGHAANAVTDKKGQGNQNDETAGTSASENGNPGKGNKNGQGSGSGNAGNAGNAGNSDKPNKNDKGQGKK